MTERQLEYMRVPLDTIMDPKRRAAELLDCSFFSSADESTEARHEVALLNMRYKYALV